jgi:hypothetical protein
MAARVRPGMPARLGIAQDLALLKKERVLTALTKMNDRDTQRGAAEELLNIVHVG